MTFGVAGIDISSHNIDLVVLDENSDRAEWTRFVLPGATSFVRCRAVAQAMPQPGWFVSRGIYLCAIERPKSRFYASLAAQLPVFGAVVASLPQTLEVWELAPTDWRQQVGLAGNATKDDVAYWARALWGWDTPQDATQDALDAYCIAYAAREMNAAGIRRKAGAA